MWRMRECKNIGIGSYVRDSSISCEQDPWRKGTGELTHRLVAAQSFGLEPQNSGI